MTAARPGATLGGMLDLLPDLGLGGLPLAVKLLLVAVKFILIGVLVAAATRRRRQP